VSVPGSVENGAFAYRTRKGGEVVISHRGRPVVTLRGERAAKFQDRVEGLGDREAQLLMARATGNFKRGNERR
jgi:antitoxin (DNA-binding transcriptional repressor) of toxin-antitoxin stability system